MAVSCMHLAARCSQDLSAAYQLGVGHSPGEGRTPGGALVGVSAAGEVGPGRRGVEREHTRILQCEACTTQLIHSSSATVIEVHVVCSISWYRPDGLACSSARPLGTLDTRPPILASSAAVEHEQQTHRMLYRRLHSHTAGMPGEGTVINGERPAKEGPFRRACSCH